MLTRLALLVALISPTGAIAENTSGAFFNGNDLHDRCQNSESFTRGFVAGVNDAFYASSVHENIKTLRLCSPTDSDLEQLTDVVCKYLSDNPAERHYNAALLIREILTETYPCSD